MTCPVCSARFRGVRICSRCGADLSRLMTLAARAWQLREQARAAIAAGELQDASVWADQAQRLQWTKSGEMLARISLVMSQL